MTSSWAAAALLLLLLLLSTCVGVSDTLADGQLTAMAHTVSVIQLRRAGPRVLGESARYPLASFTVNWSSCTWHEDRETCSPAI